MAAKKKTGKTTKKAAAAKGRQKQATTKRKQSASRDAAQAKAGAQKTTSQQATSKKAAANTSTKKSAQPAPADRKAAEHPPAAGLPKRTAFPVVGLGASAGGLEALQEFFTHLPADTGCAFVVVTHMHREHTSMLPELLAKHTSLPVAEASDGLGVEPDHVYVAPPRDNLTIDGGVLKLSDTGGNVHLPVDHFLRSLAADQRDHAICVILSGTGSDGTIGVRAVKAEAGMAMVQKPQTAKFAGMPASAEGTGMVDFVLRPSDMPAQLAAYIDELQRHGRVPTRYEPEFPRDALHQILGTLRMRTGNDFSAYKLSTIRRRIERRMNVHRIQAPHEYVRYLKDHKHEASLLFRELLITVTSFFRDPPAFAALAESITEQLRALGDRYLYRIWVPGCATGEEAYSVAIVLHECLKKLERPLEAQLFATDLDAQAIEKARSGAYPSGIAADVSEEQLKRYFTHNQDAYRVNKEIRELVIFAPHNVLSDPPFTRLDLVVCRNLLIYFETELQKKLLPTFHYALRPGGLLFLGPSETVGPLDNLFEPVDRKWKIYQRKDVSTGVHPPILETPMHVRRMPHDAEGGDEAGPAHGPEPRAEAQVQRLLLRRFAPTTLVIEDNGNIVYIHGRTGMYLEPAEGEPQHNLLEMARKGLGTPLAAALRRAAKEQREIVRKAVAVKTNGDETAVDLVITPVREPASLRGLYLVTLRPASPRAAPPADKQAAPPAADDAGRLNELEEELRHSQESLQSTVEELESSNEELKSANEELQSANEELETSKEEMQSLNEELSTVNAELNAKIDELSHANDDMQNLLNGLDVATVFLNDQLRIKRYTEQARDLIHLVPSDLNRPLADLAWHFDHPQLIEDCRRVLRTLERQEKHIQTDDGRWLMMRILPYRTSDNVIDGVVMTFIAIDALKRAEQSAQHTQEYFESIVQTVREPLLVLNEDLSVRSANDAFYRTFHDKPAEVQGRRVYDLGDGQWDIPRLRELLEDILPHDSTFADFAVAHDFPRIGRREFVLNARRLRQGDDQPDLILLAMEDVTDREV